MGTFTKISTEAFDELQLDAGMLLNTFDPSSPSAPADSAIVCATTGGINISCVPTYSDFGEDVDNVPLNMKEFKHLDSWECKMSTTALGTSPGMIQLALGAADLTDTSTYALTTDTAIDSTKTYYTRSGTAPNYTYAAVVSPTLSAIASYYEKTESGTIVPRRDLEMGDFDDLWWVGDRADGGWVAVKLINALSTGGFTLQTTKNGKGQLSLELTGHVSASDQDTMPMEFYSTAG